MNESASKEESINQTASVALLQLILWLREQQYAKEQHGPFLVTIPGALRLLVDEPYYHTTVQHRIEKILGVARVRIGDTLSVEPVPPDVGAERKSRYP